MRKPSEGQETLGNGCQASQLKTILFFCSGAIYAYFNDGLLKSHAGMVIIQLGTHKLYFYLY